jgi:AbiV family abortive infection protein
LRESFLKKEGKLIPKAKIQEGIELCKSNIRDYLKDARLIILEGRLNHAYIFVQLAIEEFGKTVMLKEALQSATSDPILVSHTVFDSHKNKPEKAFTILDPKVRRIHQGGYGTGFARGFDISTEVEHNTRLDCAFVDFDGNYWFRGRTIDKNKLEALIQNIENSL